MADGPGDIIYRSLSLSTKGSQEPVTEFLWNSTNLGHRSGPDHDLDFEQIKSGQIRTPNSSALFCMLIIQQKMHFFKNERILL